jgi:DNA-binding transcriptional LysR family regulator
MELRQLGYFVAVAEELSFTRAARRALVAQPAISQQMLALERELGEPLFDRGPRSVRLTPAGHALLPHARAALAAAHSGCDAIAALRGLLTGRLSLGTIQYGPVNLAALIGDFHREHSGVDLRVIEGHTESLLAALAAGELDLAYAGLGPGQRVPAGFSSEVMAAEPVVLAVHPGHSLAGQESVPLARLRGQPMVTLPEGSGQRAMAESAARAAGFPPHVIAESSQLSLLTGLAARGVGAALVPQSAARQEPGLSIVQITRPALTHRLVLTWREAVLTPAGRAFLAAARHPASRAELGRQG